MADRPDVKVALAKLVMRHERLINALSDGFFDVVKLLIPQVERCNAGECSVPATVRHKRLNVAMCDHHCAAAIVNAEKNLIKSQPRDTLNSIRGTLMKEEDWDDVPNAESIRRLTDYLGLVGNSSSHTIN
jgi:hypothetical protein